MNGAHLRVEVACDLSEGMRVLSSVKATLLCPLLEMMLALKIRGVITPLMDLWKDTVLALLFPLPYSFLNLFLISGERERATRPNDGFYEWS